MQTLQCVHEKKFASFLFKLVTIYGVPRIFQNFDDYTDFQKKSRGYEIMKHTVDDAEFESVVSD